MKCVRLGLEKTSAMIKKLLTFDILSSSSSLPSKVLYAGTASNVTIMKCHPRAPTNWPCDIGTTTCSRFILFPFHLVFHPSFYNTEIRAIIPTDWSKKKKKYSVREWRRAKIRMLLRNKEPVTATASVKRSAYLQKPCLSQKQR